MPPFSRQNLKDQTFGRWTVLEIDMQATRDLQREYRQNRSKSVAPTIWICQCACGTKKSVRVHGLLSGTSQSCGCLRNDQRAEKARKRREGNP